MNLGLKSRNLIFYAALATLCRVPLAAQNYTFEPVTCGNNFYPFGMNSSGVVVGETFVNGIGQGPIYYNRACQTVPYLPLYGVSDSGWLIGYTHSAASQSNPFYLIQPGKASPLPAPWGLPKNYSYCCIDDITGTVAGNYSLDSVGFFYQNGEFTSLSSGTIAAMNNTGIVVGTYEGSNSVGFVLTRGKITPHSYPGAQQTYFYGLNDQGIIVGSFVGSGGTNIFAYDMPRETRTNLNFPPPYNSMNLVGITNAGIVALTGADHSGLVLATPAN